MRRQAGSIRTRVLADGRKVFDGRYRDVEGRSQTKRGFATRGEAQAFLMSVVPAVSNRTYRKITKQTFGAYVMTWLAGRSIKPSTKRSYTSMLTKHLVPSFGAQPLEAISTADVNVFLASRAVGSLSVKTRKNLVTLLTTMFEHAVAERQLAENPLDSPLLQRPRAILASEDLEEVETFEPDEITRIIDAAGPWGNMIHVDAMTGLRLGELLGVQWGDIDFELRVLRVRRSIDKGKAVTVKSRHGRRSIDLGDQVVALLASMRRERAAEPHDAYIFQNGVGKTVDGDNFRVRTWEIALAKAGVRYRPPKSLRHSFASGLIKAGHDPIYISRQMGHHSAAFTLKTYCHLFPGERRDGNRLEAWFRGHGLATNAQKQGVTSGDAEVLTTRKAERADTREDRE